MAQFSLFVLEESNITISGGQQLDGITGGNGSHLAGQTITLNNNDWLEVQVDDSDDTTFDDNDSSQSLSGEQVLDGLTLADGTRVEGEYTLTVSDGTNTYQIVGFNVNEPSDDPAFGTVEALAFIGGEAGFPPIGVPLTVIDTSEGPQGTTSFSSYAFPPCFAAGTHIRTTHDFQPIETLAAGDLIWTADHGPLVLRWIGSAQVAKVVEGPSPFDPVCIAAHAFGPGRPSRPLRVTQQHRVLVRGWRAGLLFDEPEVLVPARYLVNGSTITLGTPDEDLVYWHLLFDDHQIIDSDGLLSESFDPGAATLDNVSCAARDELVALFPQLARGRSAFAQPARRSLVKAEAAALFANSPLLHPAT